MKEQYNITGLCDYAFGRIVFYLHIKTIKKNVQERKISFLKG